MSSTDVVNLPLGCEGNVGAGAASATEAAMAGVALTSVSNVAIAPTAPSNAFLFINIDPPSFRDDAE